MSLEICPECFKQISSTARFCPYCGYTRQSLIPGKRNKILTIGLSLTVIFLFIVFSISWKGCKAWMDINYSAKKGISDEHIDSNMRNDGSLIFDEWYKGGILQSASVKYWRNATDENKLATCAEFLAIDSNSLSLNEQKKRAHKLLKCIDKAVKDYSIKEDVLVSEIANNCIDKLGYGL